MMLKVFKFIIKSLQHICCYILLVCTLLLSFSCTNTEVLYYDNDEIFDSLQEESFKQVTIGIEAYENIDKSYLEDSNNRNKEKNNSGNIDKSADESDIGDDDNLEEYESLDIEEYFVGEDSTATKSETASEAHRKRFIDIEYNTSEPIIVKNVYLNTDYQFATFSEINQGYATLYIVNKKVAKNYKGKVVAVNAGHGVKGGSRKRTYSHPDFTPKVSGGSTKEGAVFSYAISDGTVLLNGMQESTANLMVATALKEKLLNEGYSVLMMREDNNSRLDNIARIVIANEYADCHISIHFDSTTTDKGIFYIKPIEKKEFLEMEPLKSNVDNINALGKCLIDAFKERGEKLWKNVGVLQGDLTQIAFSTNASVDIELGDRASIVDATRADVLADGLLLGIQNFFAIN